MRYGSTTHRNYRRRDVLSGDDLCRISAQVSGPQQPRGRRDPPEVSGGCDAGVGCTRHQNKMLNLHHSFSPASRGCVEAPAFPAAPSTLSLAAGAASEGVRCCRLRRHQHHNKPPATSANTKAAPLARAITVLELKLSPAPSLSPSPAAVGYS